MKTLRKDQRTPLITTYNNLCWADGVGCGSCLADTPDPGLTLICSRLMCYSGRPALFLWSKSKSTSEASEWASVPRAADWIKLRLKKSINTVQPNFYWRSSLAESLRDISGEKRRMEIFTQSFAATFIRPKLVAVNAAAQETPLRVGTALAAVTLFSTLIHIWKRPQRDKKDERRKHGLWGSFPSRLNINGRHKFPGSS